jgi:glucokinase
MLLAGDIGGTKTNLTLYSGESTTPVLEESLPSRSFKNFEALLQQFLTDKNVTIEKACLGVAGPVFNGCCEVTNLHWVIDEKKLAHTFKIQQVKFLNDLEATGYGTLCLQEADLFTVNPGKPNPTGNIAVLAAGTGLGEAFLIWENGRYRVIPSEGGHSDFAPHNEVEIELLRFLLKSHPHVSNERVISGIGFMNIYNFVKTYRNYQEPESLRQRFETEDPNAVITSQAMAGNPVCEETLNLFMALYGSEAGNLAIKTMSTGGVYIGGGIAPKILPKFEENIFKNAFLNKGRMATILADFPIKIILNPKTALLGAAHYVRNYL